MTRDQLQTQFAKEDEKLRHECIRALNLHPGGRAFLWWLIQDAIGGETFATNALIMARETGRIGRAKEIMMELIFATGPEGLPEMMKENYAREQSRNERLSKADTTTGDYDD